MNKQDIETCKTEGRNAGTVCYEQNKPMPAAQNKTVMALIEKHGKGAPVGTCLPLLKAYCDGYDSTLKKLRDATLERIESMEGEPA